MSASRPVTPPASASVDLGSQLTPEQVRATEINRLKAKSLREAQDAVQIASAPPSLKHSESSTAGTKRPFFTFVQAPSSLRDGRKGQTSNTNGPERPLEAIQPARSFAKYVDYDFGKMTDTKGGFLTQEDDPHNKVLHAEDMESKPANMTLKDWERQQLLRSLRNQKAGPFEPGITTMNDKQKACRECGTLEIDFKWDEIFHYSVCNACKEKYPDKYSLLTKTQAKEDYHLTDPELRDEDLLPHMNRPNPHKRTFHDMMLFLRCQLEDFATKKWGSLEALDEEHWRREAEKKRRRDNKFKSELGELKRRTRFEAVKRSRTGVGGNFGDDLGNGGKHVHEWGRVIENAETGIGVKTCVSCGMEVEELEL